MTQVKLFLCEYRYNSNEASELEGAINKFLSENAEKIEVKDIKYSMTEYSDNRGLRARSASAMVIYDAK